MRVNYPPQFWRCYMQREMGSNTRKELGEKEDRRVNLGRHQAQCTICLSPDREQIEEA